MSKSRARKYKSSQEHLNKSLRKVEELFFESTNKDKWPPRVDFIVFVQKSALEGGFNGLRDDMFAWSEEYVARESQRRNGKDHKDAKRRRGEKFRDNE